MGGEVVAVGKPFGLGGTATSGIISALERDTRFSSFDYFIQKDAAINRGSSGGALFDHSSKVIGVTHDFATIDRSLLKTEGVVIWTPVPGY